MLKKIRVELSFLNSDLKKLCPLTVSEVRFFFAWMAREIVHLEEYQSTCRSLGKTPNVLALRFCDDQEMRVVQKKFRKLDRTTDVLSFPSKESRERIKIHALMSAKQDTSLGDLLISLPAVERGAKRVRRTFKKELVEVMIHGTLHLLGFDHVKGGEKARRMRKVQKQIFYRYMKI
jgi:probable rRNA maturation factor